ncbi:hypothetical protein BU16DRAFT_370277 [Lophium mytilinum]|uniref:Uncharacterized protein n=1 Tax=Lophium mytilinum TaxID=390894 RepID=A0A6A6QVL2_9PEZI|nr:hypothetical protein BU16DRAFT_370277 [Lophium mytilinum]
MGPAKSSITMAATPKATELRKQLGYGPGTAGASFCNDVRSFIANYRTRSDLSGAELYIWNPSPEHQTGLEEMTAAFLRRRGSFYWPDNSTSDKYNALRLSRDHLKITDLLKKLISRFNKLEYIKQHEQRNNKDKITAEIDEIVDNSTDARDTSPETPLESHSGMLPNFNPTRLEGERSASPSAADPVDLAAEEGSPAPPDPVGNEQDQHPGLQARSFAKKSRNPYYIQKEKDSATRTVGSKRPASAEDISPHKTAQRRKISRFESDDDELYSEDSDHSAAAAPSVSIYEARTTGRDRKGPKNYYDTEAEKRILEAIESQRSTGALENDVVQSQEESLVILSAHTMDTQSQDSVIEREIPARRTFVRAQPTPLSRAAMFNMEDERIPAPHPPAAPTPLSNAAISNMEDALMTTTRPPAAPTPFSNAATSFAATSFAATSFAAASFTEDGQPTTRPPAAPRSTTLAPAEKRQSTGPPSHRVTPTTPRLPRPKLDYSYSIILSRTPVLSTKNWYPEGNFQDMTLAQLFLELELDANVCGLVFSLEGPNLRHKGGLIDRGDEAKFQVMKRNLNRWVNVCSDNHRGSGEPLDLYVDIEIVRDEEEGLDEETEDEDEEIW